MISLLLGSPLAQGALAVLAAFLAMFVSKKVWQREAKQEERDKAKEKDRDNATKIRDRADAANDKWMSGDNSNNNDGYRD